MSEELRRYVAGFLFFEMLPSMKRVLLVRKNHPKWQAGLLNGVGGEIEPGETPLRAMEREFMEEAAYYTNAWNFFASEHGPGYEVYFYRHTISQEYENPSVNDKNELLEWHDPLDMKCPVIGNLNWLLPLALDPRPITVHVRTTGDIRKIMTW